mmetsp:Transcript_1139/g.1949  ORF Transcript_1139/g.1949 Transcript_1139/m.1949 type:complete len:280 (-) Transcript_1139:3979-4818(-)
MDRPPLYELRPMVSCSALRPESGIFSMNFFRFSSGMLPSFPPNSLNSALGENALARACNLKIFRTAVPASPTSFFRASLRAITCFLHLPSKLLILALIFKMLLRTSEKGPLEVFAESMSSLSLPSPVPIDSRVPSILTSAFSISDSTFSSAPVPFTNPSAVLTTFSTSSAREVRRSSASLFTVSAAFFSAASCLRCLSTSMTWSCAFFESAVFFFISFSANCTLAIRGFMVVSSVLVSARGPVRTAFSSSTLFSMCFVVFPSSSCNSLRAPSIFWEIWA